MNYTISPEHDGKTVLDILRKQLCLSRATVKHLKFKENGITLNGAHVTVRGIVRAGDVLSIAVEDTETPEKLTPSRLELDIAYEDDDVVVPSKPADMPTHQSFGHYGDTVANALTYRYTQLGMPFVFRPVNRLDRNTSGLLIIARNRISAAFLSDAMKEHRIKKQYIAILHGSLPCESGTVDTYMRRTQQSVIVREVCGKGEGGDRAVTEYRVICKSPTHTLVLASPQTGRTHQLRVHFASLGAPIEGDDIYGTSSALISRHALHSFLVTFPRPNGEKVTVTSALPNDMYELAKNLFGASLENIDEDVKAIIIPKSEEIYDETISAETQDFGEYYG